MYVKYCVQYCSRSLNSDRYRFYPRIKPCPRIAVLVLYCTCSYALSTATGFFILVLHLMCGVYFHTFLLHTSPLVIVGIRMGDS